MPLARIGRLAKIGVSLFISTACASNARSGAAPSLRAMDRALPPVVGVWWPETHSGLPSCLSATNCGPSALRDSLEFGPAFPTLAQQDCDDPPTLPSFIGPTVVLDFSDGVSSDGRGPYTKGTDGVLGSGVNWGAGLSLGYSVDAAHPRRLAVNLSHPVSNGGGVPLGMITVGGNRLPHWDALHTQWRPVDNTSNVSQNLHDIPVGQTVTALQMNVFFYIDGRFHLLQMGPQPWGHCHSGMNLVTGAGTSSGTIYRASTTKWVMDLPAESVGRLFDLHNTAAHAVDRGLYYVHLHYEISQ